MSEARQEITVVTIVGDGIGVEVTPTAIEAIEAACKGAYGAERTIRWEEALAGKAAVEAVGTPLPPETVDRIRQTGLGLKGPVETPVGKGIRSVNVALRKTLDLYACIRPVRYFEGVTAPVSDPASLDVVIFRENTEDVYAGIEWREGTPEAHRVIQFLEEEMGFTLPLDSGIGVKPMSERGSKRLVRAAIRHALDNGRASVTLVHKGNIMKFTEGAFRDWGYEVAADEFSEQAVAETELAGGAPGSGMPNQQPPGTILINDRIADAMFQEILLRPARYDVLALSNLNGDYISDAAAAQVGGLGIAPGANVGHEAAVFEATHGTAPDIAGQGKANPASLMLSGVMLLRHVGWTEAAQRLEEAVAAIIASGRVTPDLALGRHREVLTTGAFARAVAERAL